MRFHVGHRPYYERLIRQPVLIHIRIHNINFHVTSNRMATLHSEHNKYTMEFSG